MDLDFSTFQLWIYPHFTHASSSFLQAPSTTPIFIIWGWFEPRRWWFWMGIKSDCFWPVNQRRPFQQPLRAISSLLRRWRGTMAKAPYRTMGGFGPNTRSMAAGCWGAFNWWTFLRKRCSIMSGRAWWKPEFQTPCLWYEGNCHQGNILGIPHKVLGELVVLWRWFKNW